MHHRKADSTRREPRTERDMKLYEFKSIYLNRDPVTFGPSAHLLSACLVRDAAKSYIA